MRIWDVEPHRLCRNHLLGEHRELHAIWTILNEGQKGYSRHPETLRWQGKLKALYVRHEKLSAEMQMRGFQHNSPLDAKLAVGKPLQDEFVDPLAKQLDILRKKGCKCKV
jgi:hypothetical protein